ncbi:MAG: thioesterase family protein [Lachnospiraceae bacterium]|nr:thioesterase family protein [Lachnospiraceae bacterium]
MLAAGIKGKLEMTVTSADTAEVLKSGTLQVFATPAMIALIEETAWKSVAEMLDEGCASVGTSLNVKHLAATPVGMKVTCETELTEVDGRRLVFAVEVYDETGKVGEGTHERFVIQAEKFQQKADAKLEK